MCIGARAAHALQHVNLLLVLFAGAALSTGARLRWDPTLYIAIRELLPFEYRLLAGALPSAGAALLAAAHLAIVASQHRPKRILLYAYAVVMSLGMALEIALGIWVYSRITDFLNSPEFEELEHILATREHLQPLLQHLSRWHQIPEHLSALVKEAEADAPWNGYVAAAGLAALFILQLLGVVFAIMAARATAKAKTKRVHVNGGLSASRVSLVDSIRSSLSGRSNGTPQTPASVRSFRSGRSEYAPLKAKYKNGILVPV
ncbi:uncharacterized protein LOC125229539 isoform X2 [Leguminivora glycinivorella]|uniref:uncharacterized protein LOC125229539 isoform X2 n=1 Tax=Leguminivora glycinivorella TaxID=1035111 RepID=UPI00200CF981|nr:uncharacterized protein LOC125229539 isoform X2 [Leguminivora glycinivorella]